MFPRLCNVTILPVWKYNFHILGPRIKCPWPAYDDLPNDDIAEAVDLTDDVTGGWNPSIDDGMTSLFDDSFGVPSDGELGFIRHTRFSIVRAGSYLNRSHDHPP